MRIVGFFIKSIFTLGMSAALIYFTCGQLWMAVSLRGFVAEVKALESSRLNVLNLNRRCQSAPGSSTLSTAVAIQLRFLDSTHYQTELRCTLVADAPVMSTGTLPMFVSKIPGSSGFYIDLGAATRSTITLKTFAATKSFSTDTTKIYESTVAAADSSPATSCGGWGYQCCSADQQIGSGKTQTDGVTDCPAQCFAACTARPYILSFVTDPYPTRESTVVMSTDQLTVTFSYSASLAGNTPGKVHIDYGDGSSEDSTEAMGAFVHTYACSGPCQNTAVIKATDSKGNSSVVNDASTLYIKRE